MALISRCALDRNTIVWLDLGSCCWDLMFRVGGRGLIYVLDSDLVNILDSGLVSLPDSDNMANENVPAPAPTRSDD
ncbi:hypothetical protein Tco_0576828 [Tanacetum coccineum]